jgi:hypothetical protein
MVKDLLCVYEKKKKSQTCDGEGLMSKNNTCLHSLPSMLEITITIIEINYIWGKNIILICKIDINFKIISIKREIFNYNVLIRKYIIDL